MNEPGRSRAIKGLKERMTGKEGQIRNNLMGKRSCTPETPVLLWNGKIKRADEVVVGDVVVGDDGTPRTVVDTLQGESQLYKVKQSYGDEYGISCEHILTLKYCGHAKIHWRETQGKYGGWLVNWYDRKSKTIKSKKISVEYPSKTKQEARDEIEQIKLDLGFPPEKNVNWCPDRKKYGSWRFGYTDCDGKKKSSEVSVIKGKSKEEALREMEDFCKTIDINPIIDIHVSDYLNLPQNGRRLMMGVKLNTPVQWKKKEVHLDPYILGMWLGDGTSRGREFTSDDSELVECWEKWAVENGAVVNKYDKIHYGVVGSPNPLTENLRKYNLINNKYIPEDYIVNDEETRLKILAGLIDTDGSVEQDGATIRITQSENHRVILEGALRIARSIGFRANIGWRNVTWSSKDVTNCGKAVTLTISGNGLERIPTLLPRKKCRSSDKDMSCCKIEVVDGGVGKFFGFEVDKNHRFLLGDFTITHNCEQTGRTVIGPDPTLKMGELGVPYEMAEILTVPVMVAPFNIEELTKLVNSNGANFVLKNNGKTRINLKYALFRKGTELLYQDEIHRGNDVIVVTTGKERVIPGDRVRRNGEFLKEIRFPEKRRYRLELGDIVERKLINQDIVLLNRQPGIY